MKFQLLKGKIVDFTIEKMLLNIDDGRNLRTNLSSIYECCKYNCIDKCLYLI